MNYLLVISVYVHVKACCVERFLCHLCFGLLVARCCARLVVKKQVFFHDLLADLLVQ